MDHNSIKKEPCFRHYTLIWEHNKKSLLHGTSKKVVFPLSNQNLASILAQDAEPKFVSDNTKMCFAMKLSCKKMEQHSSQWISNFCWDPGTYPKHESWKLGKPNDTCWHSRDHFPMHLQPEMANQTHARDIRGHNHFDWNSFKHCCAFRIIFSLLRLEHRMTFRWKCRSFPPALFLQL